MLTIHDAFFEKRSFKIPFEFKFLLFRHKDLQFFSARYYTCLNLVFLIINLIKITNVQQSHSQNKLQKMLTGPPTEDLKKLIMDS